MIYLAFLGGVIFGTIVTRILIDIKSANGYFKVEPYKNDDTVDGLYSINMRLDPDQNLLKKNIIILHKEHSLK